MNLYRNTGYGSTGLWDSDLPTMSKRNEGCPEGTKPGPFHMGKGQPQCIPKEALEGSKVDRPVRQHQVEPHPGQNRGVDSKLCGNPELQAQAEQLLMVANVIPAALLGFVVGIPFKNKALFSLIGLGIGVVRGYSSQHRLKGEIHTRCLRQSPPMPRMER